MIFSPLSAVVPGLSALSEQALKRLNAIGAGWVVVSFCEAVAYVTLALAIANQASGGWVLTNALLAVCVTVIVTRAGFISGARLAGDLYTSLGNALADTKLSWFTEAFRAKVSVLAGQGVPGLMSIPAHQLQLILHAPLLPLFLMGGIGLIGGWSVAVVAGLLLGGALTLLVFAQRKLKFVDGERQQHELEVAQATREFIDHLELLKTAAGPKRSMERIESTWRAHERALAKTNAGALVATFITSVAAMIPVIGLTGFLILDGSIGSAQLLALVLLISRASAPLEELALLGAHINDLQAGLDRYKQIADAPAVSEPSADEARTPQGSRIEVVSLNYPPILHDLSVEIPEGCHLLVQGPSGSGKTTFLELLARFDDPAQGAIRMGGVALQGMSYKQIVDRIAYVGQEPIVFTGSIADNIRLGKPLATDAEVEKVARQVLLGTLIDSSELGIERAVGHNGALLSGGERQRVALARALIKNAPVLILDEATSALDEKTEQEIALMVGALPQTLIVVTHRESSIWLPSNRLSFEAVQ
ncbi:ATP-binding cassette domain-containing protein [Marinobacterium mangrovicola]|uniref:ABC-type multidrug transport system fused ATPase/permease subunit n=1 Tax=Marinobacterium mangrovicola TaxID=1476959 RepID=A0A4R1GLD9_9GAMM|nr:ABC transporter ATP-binding protein [Marinobacterium mangrovicola]TCK09274.1 ABC-type multidrug transport system fused ATPase/permease subunit [Marinobacterium mangrovicola]